MRIHFAYAITKTKLLNNCTADQPLCFRHTGSTFPLSTFSLTHINQYVQASSFIISLYSLVSVGPGHKPKLLVFIMHMLICVCNF